ncbi:MAG: LamG domain-containing protein [Candidatus Poribacteria bacterium]|nr:LamG domain-containing protein [Candidatus Poribacteria bacterium]
MKRLILFLMFSAVNITLSFSVYAAPIVTDGLVSYWTFDRLDIKDGFAEDVWGENDAKIKGNPILVNGHRKYGLKFDGDGDYVILKDTGNFGKQQGPSTFEVWLKTSEKRIWSTIYTTVEQPCDEIDEGNGILINAYWDPPEADLHTKKDYILIKFQRRSNGKNCGGYSSHSTKFPISDGQWHHFVFVHGFRIKHVTGLELEETVLYIDSIPIRRIRFKVSNPITTIPYTQPVFLGAINNNGKAQSFYYGIFDEVRIYNRALSQDEVTRNFKSTTGLAVKLTHKLSTVWGALKQK